VQNESNFTAAHLREVPDLESQIGACVCDELEFVLVTPDHVRVAAVSGHDVQLFEHSFVQIPGVLLILHFGGQRVLREQVVRILIDAWIQIPAHPLYTLGSKFNAPQNVFFALSPATHHNHIFALDI